MGQTLRRAREQLRLSLADVADIAGVARSHIWSMENGKKDVSLPILIVVSVALGIPPTDLINENLRVSHFYFYDQAISELKREQGEWKEGSSEHSKGQLIAGYAGGCCAIIVKSLLFTGIRMRSWNYPSENIKIAMETMLMQIQFPTPTVTRRHEILTALRTEPVSYLSRLGLMTQKLFNDFVEYVVKGGPVQWNPTMSSDLDEDLFRTDLSDWPMLEHFDPLASGNRINEMAAGSMDASATAAAEAAQKPKQSTVDKLQPTGNDPSNLNKGYVNLEELIESLRRVLSPRGSRSALAREFGISRQAVDNWLSGKSSPKAEVALRLLDWVRSAEAKQKRSASGATLTEPKTTRTRKPVNETESESNPPEP